MPRTGRPPRGDKPSTSRIEFRVTLNERRELIRNAQQNGFSISDWCRMAALLLLDDLEVADDPPGFRPDGTKRPCDP